jgi:LacI family transcriptional regulator
VVIVGEQQRAAPVALKRATLKDVALVAGVSHQTVSRAVNGKGEIDPETRRRVLDVARELRYRPSRFARGLVRSDLITIGLMVPDVVNPFFPEFIAGVIEAAGGREWQVVVGSTENDRTRELPLVRSLGRQVDALVGYLSHADPDLAPYVEGVPLVIVDRDDRPSAYGSVRVDIAAGVGQALRYLVGAGHRRIGMIDCDSICAPLVRRAAFLALVDEYRLPVDEGWIVSGEQSMAGGGASFDALLTAHPDVTAVFAFNDLVAIGAFQAARRRGIRIPVDCALVGFDGLGVGELLDPPLTTVHIDKRRLGELAVDQVEQLLAGQPTAPAVLHPELVVRGSA